MQRIDVLIVTAVADEYAAVLAVDTGAAEGTAWEERTASTGARLDPGGGGPLPPSCGSASRCVPVRPRQEPQQPGHDAERAWAAGGGPRPSLYNLSVLQNALAQPEPALASAREALDAYWPFFLARPAAFARDTADALDNVVGLLEALGRPVSPELLERRAAVGAQLGG
jgi:hypothetical protein